MARIEHRVLRKKIKQPVANPTKVAKPPAQSTEELGDDVRSALSSKLGAELLRKKDQKETQDFSSQISGFVTDYIRESGYTFSSFEEQSNFIKNFVNNFSGYGVLQPLIDDENVEEIYILGYDKIYVNRRGRRELTNIRFRDSSALKTYIDNILASVNRRVDSTQPIEDAHLADYNRVAVSGDVLSPQGFTFNIRKFKKQKMTLDFLCRNGTYPRDVMYILNALIDGKFNFLISGGTSSGKTTLLNAMADYFARDEFVITIEDNLELQLGLDFVLQLETRKPNLEGKGEITMNDLFKHCLRRSPDRFIIGEIRDGEVANTFITAANTGHEGCIATVHSNSPMMCCERVAGMISDVTGQEVSNSRKKFTDAINAAVQITALPNRKRVVSQVSIFLRNGAMWDWVRYDKEKENWIINYDMPLEVAERLRFHHISVEQFTNGKPVTKPLPIEKENDLIAEEEAMPDDAEIIGEDGTVKKVEKVSEAEIRNYVDEAAKKRNTLPTIPQPAVTFAPDKKYADTNTNAE